MQTDKSLFWWTVALVKWLMQMLYQLRRRPIHSSPQAEAFSNPMRCWLISSDCYSNLLSQVQCSCRSPKSPGTSSSPTAPSLSLSLYIYIYVAFPFPALSHLLAELSFPSLRYYDSPQHGHRLLHQRGDGQRQRPQDVEGGRLRGSHPAAKDHS